MSNLVSIKLALLAKECGFNNKTKKVIVYTIPHIIVCPYGKSRDIHDEGSKELKTVGSYTVDYNHENYNRNYNFVSYQPTLNELQDWLDEECNSFVCAGYDYEAKDGTYFVVFGFKNDKETKLINFKSHSQALESGLEYILEEINKRLKWKDIL